MKTRIHTVAGKLILALSLLLVWNADGIAQHLISGIVTDNNTGETLPGVTILVQGTEIGTASGLDGEYSLEVQSPNDILTVSAVGYQTLEVEIDGRETINITLTQRVYQGDELVVVGYGLQRRVSMTGAISAIDSEDIARTSATTSAEALVGKIQGVNTRITNSYEGDARPGSSTIMQIRNMGDPLFVIDGVPHTSGQFNNINVADIESISILKDASAAVYGFRASNGVVLVTTKQGTAGQRPQINLNGYYGWQDLTRFPFKEPANAYLFHRSLAEAEQNRGQTPSISPDELERWRLGTEPGYESYNQYNQVVNNPNAPQYNLNASASGGWENASYYFSIGHVNQDYVMSGHNFNRSNIQANLRADLAEGLTIGTQLSGRIENRDNVAIPGREDPIWNALLGTNSSWPMDAPYANNNPDFVNGDVRFLTRLPSTYTRDVAGWQEDRWNNFTGNFYAEYQFPFGLLARGTYSYTYKLNRFDRQRFSYDAFSYDESTNSYNVVGGFYSPLRTKRRTEIQEQFAQIQLNYMNSVDSHNFSGVVAFEIQDSEDHYHDIESVPPSNFSSLIDFVDLNAFSNTWATSARASFVGRFNYDFEERYLLEVLGRYDGSYLYAPDQRWGFFPGISVGWRLTEEVFLRDRWDFLNELKLRASWGQTGREQGINPWDYLGGATFGTSDYVSDGVVVTGVRPRGLPVIGLSWVTSTTVNLGMELSMFNDRLMAEVDVFQRKLTGLPAPRHDVLLPSEVGYSLPNENLESEANIGIEGMVRYRNQVGEISYSVGANATLARRKHLDRYRPRFGNSWDEYRNATENRWALIRWGYEVIGQFQTQEEIDNHPVNIDGQGNRTLLPGDFIYRDVVGDGVITELDQRPIAHPWQETPILSFGFDFGFAYKGIDIHADFAGATGYSFPQRLEMMFPFQAGHNSPTFMLEDRWRRADLFDPDSEWIAGRYPANRQNPGHSNYLRPSSFWDINVRYMRLKRLEIGYQLPLDLLTSLGIQRLRVYASGANLFSIDNMRDIQMDPEIAIDSGMRYPTSRVFSLGFDLTF